MPQHAVCDDLVDVMMVQVGGGRGEHHCGHYRCEGQVTLPRDRNAVQQAPLPLPPSITTSGPPHQGPLPLRRGHAVQRTHLGAHLAARGGEHGPGTGVNMCGGGGGGAMHPSSLIWPHPSSFIWPPEAADTALEQVV